MKIIVCGKSVEKNHRIENKYNDSWHIRNSINFYEPIIKTFTSVIDNSVLVFEGEIEEPLLQVDEYLYLPEIEKSFRIYQVSKNVKGGYVYYIDYEVHVIENNDKKLELEAQLKKAKELEEAEKTKKEEARRLKDEREEERKKINEQERKEAEEKIRNLSERSTLQKIKDFFKGEANE